MTEDQTLTMIILRYGSIAAAYTHWLETPYDELAHITDDEYNMIMNWEREMHEDAGTEFGQPR